MSITRNALSPFALTPFGLERPPLLDSVRFRIPADWGVAERPFKLDC